MLICPKCKTEYRDGFLLCSDCGAQLIEKNEENEENSKNEKVNNSNWLKEFGTITAERAITILFLDVLKPMWKRITDIIN